MVRWCRPMWCPSCLCRVASEPSRKQYVFRPRTRGPSLSLSFFFWKLLRQRFPLLGDALVVMTIGIAPDPNVVFGAFSPQVKQLAEPILHDKRLGSGYLALQKGPRMT